MNRLRKSVLMAIVLILTSNCLAQSGPNEKIFNQFQVRVVRLSILDVSTDKLVIGVGLSARSKRNLTVDQLVLARLQLNGVPIYAAPFKDRLKLRSDRSVTLPEQLQVTVYLHDLNSLKPLRDAVSNGYATVNGVVTAHVPLNPLERLILLSSHAEVSTSLHQQVAFNIPGGPLATVSLVKVLDLADAAFKALDSTITSAAKLCGK
jgi:hypothetical protein